MHYTILEELREIPEPKWEYVDPKAVRVGVVGAPKYSWIEDICENLPQGKMIMLPVPEDRECLEYANLLRSALLQVKRTQLWKWSIRQSADKTAVIVLKGEVWPTLRRQMDENAALGAQ